jgi:DNA-binding LacI/PurR family transcriptional regulator
VRIAALGANDRLPAALQRREAFLEALARLGLRPHSVIATRDWERQTGATATDALVSSGRELPDAVFAFNDTLAIGALRSLRHHGIDVPGTVAVAGIDDIDEATYTTPSLTTVSPDLGALADTALGLLEDQIARRRAGAALAPPRQEWAPFRLAVRESTGDASGGPGGRASRPASGRAGS